MVFLWHNKFSTQKQVIEEKTGNSELPFFVSLFQGYPKGDKLENIIKYGTQLGVSEFHPTLMKRSVFKLDSNSSKVIKNFCILSIFVIMIFN